MQRIRSRTLGMPTNDAGTFKSRQTKEALKSLAKKHKLEVEQVRRIVGLD
jgi:hypothetical protein